MDVRAATAEDIEGIRTVAHDSLLASYGHALDETVIADSVDRWYGSDRVTEALTDDRTRFVVAVENGDVIGFAEGYVQQGPDLTGDIDWVHVTPEHRGEGIGHQLLKRIESELVDADVTVLEGAVLEANERGAAFYEEQGYERVDEREVEIGEQSFVEHVYAKFLDEEGRQVVMESKRADDGTRIYVAYDESVRGAYGPFYVTYLDTNREGRYGWLCGNCDSTNVAMDAMDTIECSECGNRRKPARWDAAYL